ncbi:hypothetical protein [Thermodesulforhabdus norvegica]|uniref:Uncharacterized protein n=1 Tax=Thermodesulforhabdus norvegica TaxID=39841 RepID=A0A1I4SVF9_9BACT|nr:hypothetical protein [Thermodesulforhabdus norvegica]SFM68369.1 hypothetical protein SAMN05660836_01184 [Thermodesulforhabdus norvegica]
MDVLDVRLMASQRMDDSDEGGGRMSGEEILDGALNAIFPDIDRIAATVGRVNLRKVFPAVMTHSRETYYGSHVIISEPPTDDKVQCLLFSTGSPSDRRADAVDRIEGYIVQGPRYIGYLWGPHPDGMRTITIIQPEQTSPPEFGTVLYLEERDVNDQVLHYEYVKLISVDDVVRTFVIATDKGTVTVRRRVVTCEIYTPLSHAYTGGEVVETTYPQDLRSWIYSTVATDRTNYYGISRLISDAAEGDTQIRVDSIFAQLVPTNRSETVLADVDLANDVSDQAPYGSVTLTLSDSIVSGKTFDIGRIISPGTLRITRSTYTWTDDGLGNLMRNGQVEGFVSYADGKITYTSVPTLGTSSITITFTPGFMRPWVRYTDARIVGPNNQGYSWVMTLQPPPTVGSVIVDYRSQERWYRLVDNCNGALIPLVEGAGGGTINYQTGTITITCGALPDVGSMIIAYWSVASDVFSAVVSTDNPPAGQQAHDVAQFIIYAGHSDIAPGTFSISWTVGENHYTLTDDGHGNLTGTGGTGEIQYAEGVITLWPDELPDPGTTFDLAYNYGSATVKTFTGLTLDGNGNVNINVEEPIVPGSLRILYAGNAVITGINEYTDAWTITEKWPRLWVWNWWWRRGVGAQDYGMDQEAVERGYAVTALNTARLLRHLRDDGAGNLSDMARTPVSASIDYNTGAIQFAPDWETNVHVKVGGYYDWQMREDEDQHYITFSNHLFTEEASRRYSYTQVEQRTYPVVPDLGYPVKVSYYSTEGANYVEETVGGSLVLHANAGFSRRLVEGGVSITLDGVTYWDRLGTVYRYADDGKSLIACGTVDKSSGTITMDTWAINSRSNSVSIWALTTTDKQVTTSLIFRIPGKLRPGTLNIVAALLDGTEINVTAGTDGRIVHSNAYGFVNYSTGVVTIAFGTWMSPASAYVDEVWYDVGNVDEVNDRVLRPQAVDTDTLRYSCVLDTDIPLDADLIGINPTRLPPDGKVPIYREGYIAIVHHSLSDVLPTVSPGDQVTLSRGDIDYVELRDQENAVLPLSLYTVDKANGVVTFNDGADLSIYVQPFTAIHRREDMVLLTQVDITGLLRFTPALRHSYPAYATYVSSALVTGALQAAVHNVFTQKSWTGEWSDTRIGDPTTANYDVVNYPIEVWNDGAIEERWAIVFTSSTDFYVAGETVGVIANGNTASDCAPINPATSQPYFIIRSGGWGMGWAAGNCLRFNTSAAHAPIWVARTILPGAQYGQQDSVTIQIRGDAN